jgi:predicted transcriptional regulator
MRIHARNTDPDTSHDAAGRMSQVSLERATEIVELLEEHPDGLTSQEIADAVGRHVTNVSPLLRPMAREGEIHTAPEKRENRLVWLEGPDPAGYVEPTHEEREELVLRGDKGVCAAILDALRAIGDSSSLKIANYTGIKLQTVSASMRPLERGGLVREAGRHEGRIVWRVIS